MNSEIKHITFIGSGNVASAMAEEFFKKGLIITQVFSRNLSQANLLSEKVNSKGIGLGLYICKQISQKFGGSVSVESETDKGSKFTFTFMCDVNVLDDKQVGE